MNLATSHSYSAADHRLDTHDQSRQSSEPLLPSTHKLFNGKFRDYVDIGRARPTLDAGFDGERTVTFAVSHTTDQMQDDIPFDGIDGVQATQDSTHFHRLPFAKPNHNGHDHADSDSSSVTSDSHPRPSSSGHYNKPGAFGKNATHNSSTDTASGTLVRSFMAILGGLSLVNVTKGFVWSIALTNMHFMGVKALQIPGGTVVLSPIRVVLCAAISWSVCCVGVILMAAMESNLKQQVLFSVVAATGVAAVHFSGLFDMPDFSAREADSAPRDVCVFFPVYRTPFATRRLAGRFANCDRQRSHSDLYGVHRSISTFCHNRSGQIG